MYRLDSLVAGIGPESFSKSALDGWLGQFQLLYGAIDLFGTEAVRQDIGGIKRELDAIGTTARKRAGGTRSSDFADEFASAYIDGRAKLRVAVGHVVEAMRTDLMALADSDVGSPNQPR
jgi:hypothetical protein